MTWNRLGNKELYNYTADDGNVYAISTDTDLAIDGLGLAAAAPVPFDADNPPANFVGAPPKRFTPRTVFAEADADGARKNLIAFHPTAALYQTTGRQAVTIDEETGVTTGRRGEKLTF